MTERLSLFKDGYYLRGCILLSDTPRSKTLVSLLRINDIVCSVTQEYRLFATPQMVAPLSMEFSRQEYWIKLPFPIPGNLPHPGIEPVSLALLADSLPSEPPGK